MSRRPPPGDSLDREGPLGNFTALHKFARRHPPRSLVMPRAFSVGDIADADDHIAWPAFRLVFTPILAHHLHQPVSLVVHHTRRCPEVQLSADLGPILCDRCADHVDAESDTRFRKLRAANASSTPLRGTELAQLIDFLRTPSAGDLNAGDGAALLLQFRRHNAPDAPPWVRSAFFQLVNRIPRQVVADVGRRELTKFGAAARPERDLMTARWAVEILPDQAQRRLVADYLASLQAGTPNPLSSPSLRWVLDAALDLLRRMRPEFYNGNVTGFLLRGRTVPDATEDLDRGRLFWDVPGDSAEHPDDHVDQERCRQRILDLLEGPSTAAKPMRRFLNDLCDVAFARREVVLVESARRHLRLTPDIAALTMIELGRTVIEAGLDWVDTAVATIPN